MPSTPPLPRTPPLLPSRIVAVTVFGFGAEVVREAILEPSQGALPEAVLLGGLPLSAPEASFQIRIEPTPGVQEAPLPTATGLTLGLQPPPPDPELPPATDEELRAAERAVARRQADQALLERQIAALEDLASPERPPGAEGEPPRPSPTTARLQLGALRREEQERLLPLLSEAREAARLALEDLAALRAHRERDAQRRQLHPHELRRQALIALRPPPGGVAAGRCRLRLTYLVPAARWSPSYHLSVDPGAGPATLTLRALVCQAGDDDWLGVALTLSTADALQWADLPRLHPQRIGRARTSPPATGWRPAPVGAEELYAEYDLAFRDRRSSPSPQPAPARAIEVQAAMAPPPPVAARAPVPLAECELPVPCAAPASVAAPRSSTAFFAKRARAHPEAKSAGADMPVPAAEPGDADLFCMSAPSGGSAPPEAPQGMAAADTLLAYDSLWMPGPGDPGRGRLRVLAPEERERAGLSPALRERLPAPAALQRHLSAVRTKVERIALPAGFLPPRRGSAIDQAAFDHAWRAEQPVDVPGDGRFHSVAVFSAKLPARLRYVAVPREAREVFRCLRLDNTLPTPLLEGPVDVDLGQERLPTARLPATPAGGHADLGLGVEERLKQARNARFSEESRGMVSRRLGLLHQVEIELRSLLPHPAEIEVRERMPVLREKEEEIEITVGKVEPPWEDWQPEDSLLRGAHRWQLTLAAGEVRTLRAAYTISISAKHELVGGNRRED